MDKAHEQHVHGLGYHQDPSYLQMPEQRIGQDGWPSPAMTHLGSHLYNYQMGMENGAMVTYESPIVPVKLQNNQEASPKSSEQ